MIETRSRGKILDDIFSEIAGIVEPGDLIFYITQYPTKTLNDEVSGRAWPTSIRIRMRRYWRPWTGLNRDDLDKWHVGIYIASRKRAHHRRINLWVIHSTPGEGVHLEQISPRRFTNNRANNMEERNRLEILRFGDITKGQRTRIVEFAHSKLGSEFDDSKLRNILWPYILGFPDLWRNPNEYSCQQLALCSYGAAGIYFPHPYRSLPIFNVGKILRHPLGHPSDRVDPKYPYLMDHHLYQDSRFFIKAAVFQDKTTNEITIERENLRKWSWDKAKRASYIEKKLITADQ